MAPNRRPLEPAGADALRAPDASQAGRNPAIASPATPRSLVHCQPGLVPAQAPLSRPAGQTAAPRQPTERRRQALSSHGCSREGRGAAAVCGNESRTSPVRSPVLDVAPNPRPGACTLAASGWVHAEVLGQPGGASRFTKHQPPDRASVRVTSLPLRVCRIPKRKPHADGRATNQATTRLPATTDLSSRRITLASSTASCPAIRSRS